MGACFQWLSIDGSKTKDEVVAHFEKAQTQDRYDNGHSYSGGIGMADGIKFRERTFDTEGEAHEWLADNAQKWEEALAVRYKAKDGQEKWAIGAWCAS